MPSGVLALDDIEQWTMTDPYPWGCRSEPAPADTGGARGLALPSDRVSARAVSSPFGQELRWSDHSNIEPGYCVERPRVADNVWRIFAITAQDTISYFDHTVQSSTAYNDCVRAIFRGGQFSYPP